jgi:CysZ protein
VQTGVPRRTAAGDFLGGVKLLGRGFGIIGRRPGLLVMGMVPGLISMTVVVGGLATLAYFVGDIATWMTPFADGWVADLRTALRFLVIVGIMVSAALVAIMTFTALTLTIGDPFYEALSVRVDASFGPVAGTERPWTRTLFRNLADSLRLVAFSVGVSALVFLLGLIPVVGQVAAPVLEVMVGGWVLAVEISGVAFNRRGLRLAERRRLLRANRALALGFGIPVFLIFLVPFAAIFVMPAAVAGATLLTRRVLGEEAHRDAVSGRR